VNKYMTLTAIPDYAEIAKGSPLDVKVKHVVHQAALCSRASGG
jgi:hypothetical protein